MGMPIITVNLHGMYQDEAIKEIERAINSADSSTYHIQLIHGFNRGTSLKNMILSEYKHDNRIKRVMPGDNLGVTVLVLREL